MSWKQYGGIYKLDQKNNVNVNNLTADNFILQNAYQGNFEIIGNLTVDSATKVKDLYISGNTNIQNYQFTDLYVTGLLDVAKEAYLHANLYIGPTDNNVAIYGVNGNVGFNNPTPMYTVDICGNTSNVFSVYSSQLSTQNIIAQNVNYQGVSVSANTTSSALQFYFDSSINQMNTPDAIIGYLPGGTIIIDVSNVLLDSSVSISNRTGNKNNIYPESLVVYDTSAGVFLYNIYQNSSEKVGNAATFVAQDSSSATFINIVTPNKQGMNIGGGVFPNDQSRSMGVLGWTDSTNEFTPAQMIVSGSSNAIFPSTIGFNTYSPKVDNYAMDINGPVIMSNGHLVMAEDSMFEIISMSNLPTFGNNLIAVGSPSTLTSRYQKYILYSNDGGNRWIATRVASTGTLEDTSYNFTYAYTYDSTYSAFVGDGYTKNIDFINNSGTSNIFMYHTNNQGSSWILDQFTGSKVNDNVFIYYYYPNLTSVAAVNLGGSLYKMYSFAAIQNIQNPDPVNNQYGLGYFINAPSSSRIDFITYNNIGNINSIYAVNNSGTVTTYAVGNGIGIFNFTAIGTGFTNTGSYQVGGYYHYNSVYAKGVNAIAVGYDSSANVGIISYTTNSGVSWATITTDSRTLRSVYIFDPLNAIAVGDSTALYYTNTGFSTWSAVPYDLLNASGNANILNNANFKNVTMVNASTVALTSTLSHYTSTTLGESNIFHLYLPDLFNDVNNNILDICGNMTIYGYAHIVRDATIDGNLNSNGYLNAVGIQSNSINANSVNANSINANIITGNAINGNVLTANYYSGINGNIVISSPTSQSNIYVGNSSADNIFFLGTVQISQQTFIDLTVSNNLNVGGDTAMTGNKASLSTSTGTLVISGGMGLGGNAIVGGRAVIQSGASSISTSTGSLTVSGGVGITENLYVGGNLSFQGSILSNSTFLGVSTMKNTADSTSTSTGSLIVSGGVGIRGNVNMGGNVVVYSTQDAISSSSGSLIISGGVGITKNTYLGGNLTVLTTTPSISSSTGSLIVGGGVGIRGNVYTGGNAAVLSTTNTSSTSSGALVVSGGVGIGKDVYIGGNVIAKSYSGIGGNVYIGNSPTDNIYFVGTISNAATSQSFANVVAGNLTVSNISVFNGTNYFNSTTASTSTSTGSLIISGGIGVAGNIGIGGLLNIQSNVASTSISTGVIVVSGGIAVGGNIYVGGTTNMITTIFANSTSTGGLVVSGGLGLGLDAFVGGSLSVNGIYTSTNYGSPFVLDGSCLYYFKFEPGDYNSGTNSITNYANGSNPCSAGSNCISSSVYYWGSGSLSPSTSGLKIYLQNGFTTGSTGLSLSFWCNNNNSSNSNNYLFSFYNLPSNNRITIQYNSSGYLVFSATDSLNNTTSVIGTFLSTDSNWRHIVYVVNAVGAYVYLNGSINNYQNHTNFVYNSFTFASDTYIGSNNNTNKYSGFIDELLLYNRPIKSGEIVNLYYYSSLYSIGISLLGNTTMIGNSSVYGNTISAGTSTGALTVKGGVGIGGAINIGSTAAVLSTTASTSTSTGAMVVSGGVGIGGSVYTGGAVNVVSTTASTTTSTGAMVVSGGVGIGGSVYTGGAVNIVSTTVSNSTTSGALIVSGGLGIGGSVYTGGAVNIVSTTASTTTSTGALIVSGGLGIGGSVYTGGTVNIGTTASVLSTTASTSTTSGALLVSGGVGIGGNLYIGGNVIMQSTTVSTSTSTGALLVSGGVGIAGNVNILGNTTIGNSPNNVSNINLGGQSDVVFIGGNSVNIGYASNNFTFKSINDYSIGVGYQAGQNNINGNMVAIGYQAGQLNTYTDSRSVYIGYQAGQNSIHLSCIAIGNNAGNNNQTDYAIAFGDSAGNSNQGSYSVAIGYYAGNASQKSYSVAIGNSAGNVNQSNYSVAIGNYAANSGQGNHSIAIGNFASNSSQGNYSIAIGQYAGYASQASYSVAIGQYAGYANQGINSIAIGNYAGNTSQGGNSIAIGNYAAVGSAQGTSSIVLSASSISNATYAANSSNNAIVITTVVSNAGQQTKNNIGNKTTITGDIVISSDFNFLYLSNNNMYPSGNVVINSTTTSTSTSTGSLIISGGVGIGGNLYTVGAINVGTTASTSTSTGALIVSGGVGIGGSMYTGGAVNIVSATASTTSSTGALIVNGGVGIGGSLYAGGAVNIGTTASVLSTTESNSTTSGAFIVGGGVGIRGNLYTGGNVVIQSTTASTSTSTGSLVVSGGVGIGGAINIGTTASVLSTVVSTSTSSGAVIVSGGVGIGGNLYTNGNVVIQSTTASTNPSTGALVVSGGIGIGGPTYIWGPLTSGSNYFQYANITSYTHGTQTPSTSVIDMGNGNIVWVSSGSPNPLYLPSASKSGEGDWLYIRKLSGSFSITINPNGNNMRDENNNTISTYNMSSAVIELKFIYRGPSSTWYTCLI